MYIPLETELLTDRCSGAKLSEPTLHNTILCPKHKGRLYTWIYSTNKFWDASVTQQLVQKWWKGSQKGRQIHRGYKVRICISTENMDKSLFWLMKGVMVSITLWYLNKKLYVGASRLNMWQAHTDVGLLICQLRVSQLTSWALVFQPQRRNYFLIHY